MNKKQVLLPFDPFHKFIIHLNDHMRRLVMLQMSTGLLSVTSIATDDDMPVKIHDSLFHFSVF